MKRIVLCVLILSVLAFGCFYSSGFVNGFADRLIEGVHEIEKNYIAGDLEKCSETAKALFDEWSGFVDLSILAVDPSHTLEIASTLTEIYSFAQSGSDDIYAACDRAEVEIDLFRDMQIPTLWRIL